MMTPHLQVQDLMPRYNLLGGPDLSWTWTVFTVFIALFIIWILGVAFWEFSHGRSPMFPTMIMAVRAAIVLMVASGVSAWMGG